MGASHEKRTCILLKEREREKEIEKITGFTRAQHLCEYKKGYRERATVARKL